MADRNDTRQSSDSSNDRRPNSASKTGYRTGQDNGKGHHGVQLCPTCHPGGAERMDDLTNWLEWSSETINWSRVWVVVCWSDLSQHEAVWETFGASSEITVHACQTGAVFDGKWLPCADQREDLYLEMTFFLDIWSLHVVEQSNVVIYLIWRASKWTLYDPKLEWNLVGFLSTFPAGSKMYSINLLNYTKVCDMRTV